MMIVVQSLVILISLCLMYAMKETVVLSIMMVLMDMNVIQNIRNHYLWILPRLLIRIISQYWIMKSTLMTNLHAILCNFVFFCLYEWLLFFSVIVLLQHTMKWQLKHSIDMCSDVIYYDSCQKKAFYLHSPSRIIPLPTVMQQSIHVLHLSVHQISTNYENSLAWTFKNLREVLHKKSHRNNISRKTKNKRNPLK